MESQVFELRQIELPALGVNPVPNVVEARLEQLAQVLEGSDGDSVVSVELKALTRALANGRVLEDVTLTRAEPDEGGLAIRVSATWSHSWLRDEGEGGTAPLSLSASIGVGGMNERERETAVVLTRTRPALDAARAARALERE